MNQGDMEVVAELVAARVSRQLKEDFSRDNQDHFARVDAHERILKGKNGEIGLITRVFNLEKMQKMIFGVLSLIGGAVVIDIVDRLLDVLTKIPAAVP